MNRQHPSLLSTDRDPLVQPHEEDWQTPSMPLDIVKSTDSKQYIRNRLKRLRDNHFVQRADRGIYELTEKGERAAENHSS